MRAQEVICGAAVVGLLCSNAAMAAAVIQQVTKTTLCENFQPAISGDGKWVVFLADCEIIPGGNTDQNYEVFLFDVEGKRFTQITDTTGQGRNNQPAINADGSRVAFTSSGDVTGRNADGNQEIVVYDRHAKRLIQVTETPPPASNSRPSLAASGDALVFLSSADLVKGQNTDQTVEAFLAERDGKRVSQITHVAAPPPTPMTPRAGIDAAVLTADGSRVVLASSAPLLPGTAVDRTPRLYLYDRTKRTTTLLVSQGGGHLHGAPAVSGDASRLAMVRESAHPEGTAALSSNHPPSRALVLWDAASGAETPIVDAEHCDIHGQALSGDGMTVAFASTCDPSGANGDSGQPNMEIFVYHAAAKTITQLTHTIRDFNHTPSIDHSGRRIAFGSDRDIHRGANLDENSEIFLAVIP